MARKFQIKRGLKANLPTLAQGEFAMTTDSGAEGVYIGNGSANIELARKDKSVQTTGDIMIGPLTVQHITMKTSKVDGFIAASDYAGRVKISVYDEDTGYDSSFEVGADDMEFWLRGNPYKVLHTGNFSELLGVMSAKVE